MSERGEVEVLLPVSRPPDRDEMRGLFQVAVREARRLVGPHGGRVLGLVAIVRAETALGELGVKMRFAVLAPERILEQSRRVIAVNSQPRP